MEGKMKKINEELLNNASCPGKLERVKQLLDAGADVNTKSSIFKMTALMIAAADGWTEMVKLLLEAGADVNAQDDRGMTALMYTVKSVKSDEELVATLIKAGADVNARDDDGMTALMYAAIAGNEAFVEMLIKAGADVNARDDDGMTALMYIACVKDYFLTGRLLAIARELLEAGADVNAQDDRGMTALMIALEKSNFALANIFYEAGAKVDVKELVEKGLTQEALHFAVKYRHEHLVPDLVSLDETNAKKFLFYAVKNEIEEALEMLPKYISVDTYDKWDGIPLLCAIKRRKIKAVELLLKHNPDLNIRDRHGFSAFYLADSDCKIIELLMKNGVKVDGEEIKKVSVRKSKLLKIAVQCEREDIVKLIFQVNKKLRGRDALFYALKNNQKMVKVLLECGADRNVRDTRGRTLSEVAKELNCQEIVE